MADAAEEQQPGRQRRRRRVACGPGEQLGIEGGRDDVRALRTGSGRRRCRS